VPSLAREQPALVLLTAVPAFENGSMDGTLTGSAADYMVVSGSFDQYCIVDRVGNLSRWFRMSSGRTTGQSEREGSTCTSGSAPTA